jgi:phosphotransferase system HPr (HPr) family protein
MEITERVKIMNRLGLHLRAAAELVKMSSKFKCRILVKNNHRHIDCKSLLNLMTLAASYGSELVLTFEGDDAGDARDAIRNLVMNRFGEKA